MCPPTTPWKCTVFCSEDEDLVKSHPKSQPEVPSGLWAKFDQIHKQRRKSMEWTAPKFEEVCLNCEINSYACAVL